MQRRSLSSGCNAGASADPSCVLGKGERAWGFDLCSAALFSLPPICKPHGGPISSHMKVMHKVSEGSVPEPW